ncbi:MAG: ATP-binding cassette domain-containing protein [Deltaproteobacteria bacterium]|nr:ATP-binding cassette domain-containing protein [Deltaproteobacteria bacterium]
MKDPAFQVRSKVWVEVRGLLAIVAGVLLLWSWPWMASAEDLLIFAGAASKPPAEKAAKLFSQQNHLAVRITFGVSGFVLSQMKLSRQGDVYFPGSSDFMEISYVPQDLALFPHLTVRENLLYGLRAQNKARNGTDSHLNRLIDTLRIGHLLARYPHGLSGGEKQRVALGRALAPAPKLLLLDEPLAALDPALKSEIQQLLLSLHRSLQFTALHVTHDLDEAYLLGDAVTVLIEGKVEQEGRKEEVFLRPLGVDSQLEIHLPNYVFRNLALQEGQKIQVAMRKESFWVIPVLIPKPPA